MYGSLNSWPGNLGSVFGKFRFKVMNKKLKFIINIYIFIATDIQIYIEQIKLPNIYLKI